MSLKLFALKNLSSNRTFMELKLLTKAVRRLRTSSSNRTFMELK